ncbi:MAG: HAD family phosphatase [Planctomycetes bacterium]|nr:HAD family phosphatase [Planctomycetota bacterium]
MDHVQAIVLDFDGVIANTEPLHFAACRELLAPFGVTLTEEEYVDRYIGVADRTALTNAGRAHGLEIDGALLDDLLTHKAEMLRDVLSRTRPMYPGVAELLRRWAADVPLAIASGARRGEIELVLGVAGVAGAIRAIVSADDGLRSKPAPDPYLKALALLEPHLGKLDPARTVAIEDSRHGIQSARAAGMRTVAVTTSFPRSALGDADLVVDALPDLTVEMLDALCA